MQIGKVLFLLFLFSSARCLCFAGGAKEAKASEIYVDVLNSETMTM